MVTMKAKTQWNARAVKVAAKLGEIHGLTQAGGAIRKTAQRRIKINPKPSPPGSSPNSRQGAFRNAVQYAVDKYRVSCLIGPSADIVADVGQAMEFGGPFRGQNYPARPTMKPALDIVMPRLPEFWKESVKAH